MCIAYTYTYYNLYLYIIMYAYSICPAPPGLFLINFHCEAGFKRKNMIKNNDIKIRTWRYWPYRDWPKVPGNCGWNMMKLRLASLDLAHPRCWNVLNAAILGFPFMGVPTNGWYIVEKIIKMDDIGWFRGTPISGNFHMNCQRRTGVLQVKRLGQ